MHDHDPIDFAMTDLPTRPGPCRKAVAEETDATAAALAREVEAAPHIADAVGLGTADYMAACPIRIVNLQTQADMAQEYRRQVHTTMGKRGPVAVEVKYGSGKVKV
jgi:hypothetical protein